MSRCSVPQASRKRTFNYENLYALSFFSFSNIMFYVYILTSIVDPNRHYTGFTEDLGARLKKHNSGAVSFTSKYKPWRLETYVAFTDRKKAIAFEKYLKSGSGRAFAKKRL